MLDHSRRRLKSGALALIAALTAMPAQAETSDWSYSTTLYGWLTSLSSTIGTRFGEVEINQSFSDILDQLNFAAFGTFEANRGPWGGIFDVAYADLSRTETFLPGAPFGGARLDTQLTAVSVYGTYRLVETPTTGFDVGAGFRSYNLTFGAALAPGVAPALTIARSENWVDPVIGARALFRLNDDWRGAVSLDLGGFGIGKASDLSVQAAAELEYSVNDTWSMMFGYRHLAIDRPLNGQTFRLELSGPLIGVRARF